MFWELVPVEETNDLQSLVQSEDPKMKDILLSPDLIHSFKAKEDFLIDFFLAQKNMNSLIELIFSTDEIKISRIGIELFLLQDSIVLKSLISSSSLSRTLILKINEKNLIHTGYIFRIFSKAFETMKTEVVKIFEEPEILSLLIQNLQISSVRDLVFTFLNSIPNENKWVLWNFLIFIIHDESIINLIPSSKSIWNSFSSSISKLHSMLKSITPHQQFSMLYILHQILLINSDLSSEFDPFINNIYNSVKSFPENLKFQSLSLQIALLLSYSSEIFKISLNLSIAPLPHLEINVLALDYVAKFCNNSQSFPLIQRYSKDLCKSFLNDPNTFYSLSFLQLIKNSNDQLKKTFAPFLFSVITDCESKNWKTNVSKVAFYLEIVQILQKEFGEKTQIIEKELQAWSKKDETPPDLPLPASAQLKNIDSLEPEKTSNNQQTSTTKNDTFKTETLPSSSSNENSENNSNNDSKNSSNTNNKTNNDSHKDNIKNQKDDITINIKQEQQVKQQVEISQKQSSNNNNNNMFNDFPTDFSFPTEQSDNNGNSNNNFGSFFNDVDSQENNSKEPTNSQNTNSNDFFTDFPSNLSNETQNSNDNFGSFFNDIPEEKTSTNNSKDSNQTNDTMYGSFPSDLTFSDNNFTSKGEDFGNFFSNDSESTQTLPSPTTTTTNDNNNNINNKYNGNQTNNKNNNDIENSFGDFPSDLTFPKENDSNNDNFGSFFSETENDSNQIRKEEKEDKNTNITINKNYDDDMFGDFPQDFSNDQQPEDDNSNNFGSFFNNSDSSGKTNSSTNSSVQKSQNGFESFNSNENNNNTKSNEQENESSEDLVDSESEEENIPTENIKPGNSNEEKTQNKQTNDIDFGSFPVDFDETPPLTETEVPFNTFLDLLNNSSWDQNQDSLTELFNQKPLFQNADEAFEYLTK